MTIGVNMFIFFSSLFFFYVLYKSCFFLVNTLDVKSLYKDN